MTSSRRPDNWIVPGGGVEPEEEPSVTATREVLEEAGVIGKLGRSLGVFEVVNCSTFIRKKPVYPVSYTGNCATFLDIWGLRKLHFFVHFQIFVKFIICTKTFVIKNPSFTEQNLRIMFLLYNKNCC